MAAPRLENESPSEESPIATEVDEFTQEWEESDITFEVEGKKIYANKMILSRWSPVMKAMFTKPFKELTAKEIPLPEKRFHDVLTLMKVVHHKENVTGV